jgi:hypothetical protein
VLARTTFRRPAKRLLKIKTGELIVSPKTANNRDAIVEDTDNPVTAEGAMNMTATVNTTDASDSEGMRELVDELAADHPTEPAGTGVDDLGATVGEAKDLTGCDALAGPPAPVQDPASCGFDVEVAAPDVQTANLQVEPIATTMGDDERLIQNVDQAESADTAQDVPGATLPDPTSISARLRNLVLEVGKVEELSRRAREVAASDMSLYDGIAASQRQFEAGLAEARRIGQEAEAVFERAFGREARSIAEPAVAEAREVEQAFDELANAWRRQGETFLAEHPDVETLLAEQRQRADDSRRRELARAKAQRFQELVTTTDAALRQGLLDDARDCLGMLGREFPAESSRFAPLQDRLQQKLRGANDAAARNVLLQASELQGRGEFDGAVRLLEAIDVSALSRETSEDVFGRWSAACSLLGQTGDLELLRSSSSQGRGLILHRDPSIPYGLVEFSALGMGTAHFQGRVVSAADPEGAAIISRARPFRAAQLPPDLSGGWYGRSYVTSPGASAPVRH